MAETHDPEILFRAFLNERDSTGRTALFMAAEANRPKTIETLLSFRADPNVSTDNGVTPLQYACDRGFQACIRVLIRGRAQVSIASSPSLIELIFSSIADLSERAAMTAYLLANGAIISQDVLDNLLTTIPTEHRPLYDKAIEEARLFRQRQLSKSIGDTSPLPGTSDSSSQHNNPNPEENKTSTLASSTPTDVISSYTGFENETSQ